MRRMLISTFGVTGLIVGLSLITSILVARNLGPEGRGLLLALMFWPAFWTGLVNLSLNEATCLHVARSTGSGREVTRRDFEASGLLLQMVMALVTAGITMGLIALFLPHDRRQYLDLVLLYALAFASLSNLDQHFKAVLQGRGAFDRLNVVRLVQPSIYMLSLLWLLHSTSMDIPSIMAAMIVALVTSTLLSGVYAGVHFSGASLSGLRATLATGAHFHLANVLMFGAAEIDKLLVLQLLDDHNIGLYSVAIAVSALGSGLIVQSLGLMLTRWIAAVTVPSERAKIAAQTIQASALLLILVNGGAALISPWLIPTLFGVEFAPAVPTVIVLLGMGVLRGLRQIIDRAARAAGITSVGIIGEAVALAAAVVFATSGGYIAGLEGLAVGLVIAQAIALAVMLLLAVRIMHIAPAQLSPLHRDAMARLGQMVRREVALARTFWR